MGMNASLVRGRDRNIYIIKLRIFELNGGPTGGRSLEVKPYFTHEELSQKETNNTKKTPKKQQQRHVRKRKTKTKKENERRRRRRTRPYTSKLPKQSQSSTHLKKKKKNS